MRNRKPTSKVKKKKSAYYSGMGWYRGDYYRKGQPFQTLLADPLTWSPLATKSMVKQVMDYFQIHLPNPKNATALEIGPGTIPIASLFPFKRIVYLDQSLAILKKLPKRVLPHFERKKHVSFTELDQGRSRRVVGDVRHLPIQGHFDFVIMNEVLTHVQPARRLKTIQDLASKTHSFLIIDRLQKPLGIIRNFFTTSDQLTHAQRRQARKIQATFVRFKPIMDYLTKNGWIIHTQKVKRGTTTYIIISATRQK
ncbi:MAG: class I SAM-dependent methyltransferase [Candidatus Diapherotrites archaeon]|nr:class I SAM-dependent methyltransferase [Candidatus Diapherotrites archaeon]